MTTLALILGTDANTDAGRQEIGAQSQTYTAACDVETRASAVARVGTNVVDDGRISRHVPEAFTLNPTGRLATSVAHAPALPVTLTVKRPRSRGTGAVLPPAFGGLAPGDGSAAGGQSDEVVVDLIPLYQTWADSLRLLDPDERDVATLPSALGAALSHAVFRGISLRSIKAEVEAVGYEIFKAWAGTASFLRNEAVEATQRVQMEASRASADFVATVRRGLDSTTRTRYVEAQAAAKAILRVEEVFERLGGRYLTADAERTLRALADEGTQAGSAANSADVMAAAQVVARTLPSPRDVAASAFAEPTEEWIALAMRSAAIEVSATDLASDVLAHVSAELALAAAMRLAQEASEARARLSRGPREAVGDPGVAAAALEEAHGLFHEIALKHLNAHPRVLELVAGASRIVKACEAAADFAEQVIEAINTARVGIAPTTRERQADEEESDGRAGGWFEERRPAPMEFGEYHAAIDPADSMTTQATSRQNREEYVRCSS